MFRTSLNKSIFSNTFLTFQFFKAMNENLEKLFKDYDGNLLNYFAGLSPSESKKFNKLIKKGKKNEK